MQQITTKNGCLLVEVRAKPGSHNMQDQCYAAYQFAASSESTLVAVEMQREAAKKQFQELAAHNEHLQHEVQLQCLSTCQAD